MGRFVDLWERAALTSLSLFWRALWAFVLGYAVSSMVRVFVTRARMRRAMGEAGIRSVALGTVFGLVSSSCSFAALATTRALFRKGAGLIPALAFLLASTNLVIELGFVIALFLSWEFVLGEYLGGMLLILVMWALVAATRPDGWIRRARERGGQAGEDGDGATAGSLRERLGSAEAWRSVARDYFMEWSMVLKDVTIGFTAAGAIAVFVPSSFFQALFPGTGQAGDPDFLRVVQHAVVGPVAAFCTFIGSMGNVPLAGLLYHEGVSFAGVLAFLFSDLVVLPVLRIQVGYYGWKLALYIAGVFLVALVAVSVGLHYAFDLAGILPRGGGVARDASAPTFAFDSTFFLNLAFLGVTAVFAWIVVRERAGDGDHGHGHGHGGGDRGGGWSFDRVLRWVAVLAGLWLAGGAALAIVN